MINYKLDNSKRFRKSTTKFTTVYPNMRFGKLTTVKNIGFIKSGSSRKSSVWLCRCDCGNEKQVPQYSLMNKHVQSCGCLQKESRQGKPGDAGLNQVIKVYKRNAESRNLIWELTKEQAKEITSKPCFYCGKLPEMEIDKRISENGKYIYNGIDRLDNSKGYFIKNVVSCCKSCNRKKSDFSLDWMIKILKELDYEIVKKEIRCDDRL
jgi:hypothetical protein